jgi:tRNA 2-thiouridine synthesizing protein A
MGEAADVLDLRGVKCPLPALLTRRHLAGAPVGTVIIVLADDPMAAIDVPHMCRNEGFETVAVERQGNEARMTLRKP